MTERRKFEERCRTLFADILGNGRRWKTACAHGLGIGRATLYRYFGDEGGVPDDIWTRLEEMEAPSRSISSDQTLVSLYATALAKVQSLIDENGYLSAPYPAELRRALDIGAARNFATQSNEWPTDLSQLMARAKEPLFRWVHDLSWDRQEEFFSSRLIEDGEITTDCRRLAIASGNPEQEIAENVGYEMLVGICRDRTDGDQVYRAWRQTVIQNPVIQGYASIIIKPELADVERIDEIVESFYQRVPEALAINGFLPTCTISGTILRRAGDDPSNPRFHTECRDPEAIRRASAGVHNRLKFRPGMMQLRRTFRTYWCLPGQAELELHRRLIALGWDSTLWPDLDRVDLVATSPDGKKHIAADVKDYLSPSNLAARFAGFKEYSASHQCYLVIPDYLLEIDSRFEAKFEAIRASYGKMAVSMSTVSGLLNELGAV